MARHILYAYVDGSDLEDVAAQVQGLLADWAGGLKWGEQSPFVVNQRALALATDEPGDLPEWELGLNMELPDPGQERPGWFRQVEELATFLQHVCVETNRTFVLGISDANTGIADDLFYISSEPVDIHKLRTIIGA